MNGIISESASSCSVSKPKIITSIILGGCLFSGFVSGMSISPSSLTKLNPFHTETLKFGKIAWISSESTHDFKIADGRANLDSAVQLTNDLNFVPFELHTSKMKRFHFTALKPSHTNFLKLEQAVETIKEVTRYDAFEDYRTVSSRMRNEFVIAMNETPATEPEEVLAMAAAAADPQPAKETVSDVSKMLRLMKSQPVVVAQAKKPARVHLAKQTPSHRLMIPVTQPVAVQEEAITTTAASATTTHHQKIDEQNALPLSIQEMNTQSVQVPYVLNNTESKTAEKPVEVNVSSGLSLEEQKKLTDAFLGAQIVGATKIPVTKAVPLSPPLSRTEVLANNDSVQNNDPDPVAPDLPITKKANRVGTTECSTLSNHDFTRPNSANAGGLDSQICPASVTWLSKSKNETGYVKLEGDDFLPTLTLHPAPNDGATLLLDQNGLALIALKSGIHITKGMGMILGSVPEGYKVDFSGRGEETEYFESSGKNYFAILNAEPGAGVVEVASKTNPNLSSTAFTPVLEDTISYLDLSAPVARTLNVKVVKSGIENDPEVAKLSVSLATQAGIQGITRADGQATLRNVNLIPGFPVFIDVTSRTEDSSSYTYRYELKHPRRSGTFVVNEMSEKTIYHWLKQVKQGLSDQSAMVVGMYDRKRLDGFRNPHFSQVEPLTSKFGLEPINYTVMWDGKISTTEPLEGDVPRFMSVQVPEGLSQIKLLNESKKMITSEIMPISPRVIHVISE